MSLTKEKVIDQITVLEDGTILYREVTRILEDGIQISQTFHRTSLMPGQDISAQPANVAAIANAAWTPEVIASYQSKQATSYTDIQPSAE